MNQNSGKNGGHEADGRLPKSPLPASSAKSENTSSGRLFGSESGRILHPAPRAEKTVEMPALKVSKPSKDSHKPAASESVRTAAGSGEAKHSVSKHAKTVEVPMHNSGTPKTAVPSEEKSEKPAQLPAAAESASREPKNEVRLNPITVSANPWLEAQKRSAAGPVTPDDVLDDEPPAKKRRGPSGGYYLECFLREVITNMRHNPMMSVASVSTVMVLALILGIFVLIIANLESLADQLTGEMQLKVYMSADFKPEQINAFKSAAYEIGHVAKVNFVSKDEAFKKLRRRLNAKLDLSDLESNPLPDAFEIPVDDPAFLEPAAQKIARLPGVEVVDYGREEAQKLMKLNHIVRIVGFVILAMLFASTLLIISNTIRLTVFARRKEIDIMQLVGAADWFIRWPFILEGITHGMLGAAAASLLIDVSYRIVVPQIQHSISFLPILLPSQIMPYLNLGLVGLGCLVGALGSLISVNRHLKA